VNPQLCVAPSWNLVLTQGAEAIAPRGLPSLARSRPKGTLLMLWWLIGIWLASGAVLPVFWLISMAYRWLTSSPAKWAFKLPVHRPDGTGIALKVRHIGLYVLFNLVSMGALILLLVGSFCNSNITMRDLLSASTVAQARATKPAEARPILSSASPASSPSSAQMISAKPAEAGTDGEGVALLGLLRDSRSLGEAEQVASIRPQNGGVKGSAEDDASHNTGEAVPQVPAAATLVTVPVTALAAVPIYHKVLHRPARGSSAHPYATPPSRGTWLYAPISNGGANT
jgi:uncharacterized RDD family membrane protein YckC